MKNKSIEIIKSKIKILVKGKNVNRFIFLLYRNRIPLLSIDKRNKDEVHVVIYFKDYDNVLKLNTIYEIFIIEYGGWIKEKKKINKNKKLIASFIIAIIILFMLSKMIFSVEVITNDQIMKEKLLEELNRSGISKFKLQKSYHKIEEIKEKILSDYEEYIEWLEIEKIGTRYIVRYEPRIIKEEEIPTQYRHLVAKKNAVIIEVLSSRGQIVRRQNDYVSKGDIIVSGYIFLHDQIKDTVSAEGVVYGEVWYELEIFYPFGYYEQIKTGSKKEFYSIQFIDRKLELFNFSPFKNKIVSERVILKDMLLPIKMVKEYQEEVNIISSIYTVEEASLCAINLAVNKIEGMLKEEEKIISYRVIEQTIKNNGVVLKVFFRVREDITDYLEIDLLEKE